MLFPARSQNVIFSTRVLVWYSFQHFLFSVCTFTEEGTIAMVDMSSPSVGQLLRSFARAAGMAYVTIMDQSTLLPVDVNPDLHLSVEPPGSAMLKIISDIVKYQKLTKIAILYDTSFGKFNVNGSNVIYFLLCVLRINLST